VCRINGYLRRDLQQARDEIRQNRDNIRKQAVQQDALSEIRRELHATPQILDHVWELLAQRKVKNNRRHESKVRGSETEGPA